MASSLSAPNFAQDAAQSIAVADLLITFLSSSGNASDTETAGTARAIVGHFDGSTSGFKEWRSYLRYFWANIFDLAIQIPHSDRRQDDLCSVLVAIRDLPPPANIPKEFQETSSDRFWTDLPGWRSVWVDFEKDAPLRPPLEQRPPYSDMGPPTNKPPWRRDALTGDEWANLNAFLARLHQAVPDLQYMDLRGIFAILEALEQPGDAAALNDLVPAAACWMLYAGAAVRSNATQYAQYADDDPAKRMPWSRGDLFHGQPGFSEERWAFWQSRCEDIKGRHDLRSSTKDIAGKAYEKLRAVDVDR